MASEVETPGKRTMATVVDFLANKDPGRVICKVSDSSLSSDGFVNFDVNGLSKATRHMANLIDQRFGQHDDQEVIMYLGNNDARYLVFIISCHKTGRVPLLSSTGNSIEAHVHLINQTGCSGILFSQELAEQAHKIKSTVGDLKLLEVPTLGRMLEGSPPECFFQKTYSQVEDETAVIIHSSGTTGMPKAIKLTHGFLGCMDAQSHVPVPPGRESAVPGRLGRDDLFFPPHHCLISWAYSRKLCQCSILVELIKRSQPSVAVLTPTLVEEVSKSGSSLEALSHLKMVYIGGASLAPEVGRVLSERINLTSVMGASELGLVLSLVPEDKSNWDYFEWNPNFTLRMEQVGEDLFELVIPREATRELHGNTHTFPDISEYHTKDLFSPHPSRPNLWKFQGRSDETISLSNGQKLNPVPMEKIIEGHPLTSRAMVFGQGKPLIGLLVEPNWNHWDHGKPLSELVDILWSTVEKANILAPSNAQIGRMRIGMAKPEKPFSTTPKGSTRRLKVLQEYEGEIESIYQHDDYWTELFKNG
ncbi:hypothetical protein N7444_012210 [Penicillium canescens]|nr:hypothetical protein N7444_012210 [Penicillium canescens]